MVLAVEPPLTSLQEGLVQRGREIEAGIGVVDMRILKAAEVVAQERLVVTQVQPQLRVA